MKKLYIGIDAHKVLNHIALAFPDMKAPTFYQKVSTDLSCTLVVVRKILKQYGLKKEEVQLCYEAGPTGFVLARRLIHLGYDCIVVAPSLIPTKSGDRKKTDRRDARKLAGYLRANELTAVHIPDVEDEVIRDICRGRTDAVNDKKSSKQQLLSFLLRNGYHYKEGTTWTQPHMRYLRELVMPHPTQKILLEEYIRCIDNAEEQIKRMEDHMETLLKTWKRKPLVDALMGLRGFKMVAAMVMVSEIGHFGRFKHPKQLMAYLGLIPSENSSGEKRRMGSITKCGNAHARWILIGCAGHYRMLPKISKELSRRQEGLSRDVKKVSWHAQNRLSKRWYKLALRGLHENKIKTAIARELSSYIWDIAMLIEQQDASCPSSTLNA